MQTPIPDTTEFERCDHCSQRNNTWLWRLVEVFPEYTYEKLCQPCYTAQAAGLTPEAALRQARAIVAFEHKVISGVCVRAVRGAR